MKKLILISLLFAFSFAASAQVYQTQAAYGFQYKRLKIDSTLHIPTFCGVPTLRGSVIGNQAAIAIDSCNKRLYFYDPKDATWNLVTGSGGGSGGINKVYAGYLLSNVNDSTLQVDTATLFTLALRLKDSTITYVTPHQLSLIPVIDTTNKWVQQSNLSASGDSLIVTKNGVRTASKILSGGTGTVSSIATGYGLSGGTITTTGTIIVDSAALSLKYIRIKDSAVAYVTPYQSGLKANNSNTVTVNGSTQTLGSNPIFTVSGGAEKKFNTATFWEMYGDSYGAGQGATIPSSQGFAYLLSGLYQKPLINRSVGGYGLWRLALLHNANINSTGQASTLVNNTLSVVMGGINDINRPAGINANTFKKVVNGYKTIFTNQFIYTRSQGGSGSTGVTRTGTWNTAYNATTYGGKYTTAASTATNGSYIEYAFLGNNINVAMQGSDGVLSTRGTVSITIDGTSMGSFSTNNATDGINDNTNNNNLMPMVLRFKNLSDSNHIIRVTNISTDSIVVDYFGVMKEPKFCQPILLYEVPHLSTYTYASDALVDSLNNTIDSLKNTYSEYPIVLVKTNNYLTSYYIDGVHPSTEGHRQLYTAGYKALDSLFYSNNTSQLYGGAGNNLIDGGLIVRGSIVSYQPISLAGAGLELSWTGISSVLRSYDRNAGVAKPLDLEGSIIYLGNFFTIPVSGNVLIGNSTDFPSSRLTVQNQATGIPKGSIPAPIMTTNKRDSITSSILSTTRTNAGSGYTPGTYTNVPLTCTTCANPLAAGAVVLTVTVPAGGTMPLFSALPMGTNYTVGDVLGVNSASVGGTGSGAVYTVATLNTGVIGLQVYSSDLKRVSTYDGVKWNYSALVFYGTSAPATTPLAVGDSFIDTTAKKSYIATGTSSSADWTITN